MTSDNSISYHDTLGDDPIWVGEVSIDAKNKSKTSGTDNSATWKALTVSHEGETNTATYVNGGETIAEAILEKTYTASVDYGFGTEDADKVTQSGHLIVKEDAWVSGPGVGTGSFNTKNNIDHTDTQIEAGAGMMTITDADQQWKQKGRTHTEKPAYLAWSDESVRQGRTNRTKHRLMQVTWAQNGKVKTKLEHRADRGWRTCHRLYYVKTVTLDFTEDTQNHKHIAVSFVLLSHIQPNNAINADMTPNVSSVTGPDDAPEASVVVESALEEIWNPSLEYSDEDSFHSSIVRFIAAWTTWACHFLSSFWSSFPKVLAEAVVETVRKWVSEKIGSFLEDTGAPPTLFRFLKAIHAKEFSGTEKSQADKASVTKDAHLSSSFYTIEDELQSKFSLILGWTGTGRGNLGGELVGSTIDNHSVRDGTTSASCASNDSEDEKPYGPKPTEPNVRNGGRAGGMSIAENFHAVILKRKWSSWHSLALQSWVLDHENADRYREKFAEHELAPQSGSLAQESSDTTNQTEEITKESFGSDRGLRGVFIRWVSVEDTAWGEVLKNDRTHSPQDHTGLSLKETHGSIQISKLELDEYEVSMESWEDAEKPNEETEKKE